MPVPRRHCLRLTVLASVVSAVGVGCVPFRGSPRHPPPPPPVLGVDSLDTLGITLHATNSGILSSPNPIAVQVTVTITNTAARDTTLRLLGSNCTVLLRFYRRADRTGPTTLDTSGPGVECFGPVIRRKVKAGDSTQFRSPRDGPAVDLPRGRYWLTALVTWITADGSRRTEIPAGQIDVPDR